MKLEDTIAMMTSDDYKERLRAEYWQTKIRLEKLESMITLYMGGKLPLDVNCPLRLLREQWAHMKEYLHVLIERAGHEMVFLGEAHECAVDDLSPIHSNCEDCVWRDEKDVEGKTKAYCMTYAAEMGEEGFWEDDTCSDYRSLSKEVENVCEACRITYSHERDGDRDNQTGEAMESLNSIRRKTAREYGEDPDA